MLAEGSAKRLMARMALVLVTTVMKMKDALRWRGWVLPARWQGAMKKRMMFEAQERGERGVGAMPGRRGESCVLGLVVEGVEEASGPGLRVRMCASPRLSLLLK